MTSSEYDDDFDAYLKRRILIERRTALIDRLEPPPELDRIIIGKARQAIQGEAPVRVFRAPQWAVPLGLAATILVSLSILMDLGIRGAVRKDAANELPVARISSAVRPPEPMPVAPESALSGGLTPAPAPAAAPPASPFASTPSARSTARIRQQPTKTAPWPPLPHAAAPATASSNAATLQIYSGATSIGYGAPSRTAPHEPPASRFRTAEQASGSADPAPVASLDREPMETVTITATRYQPTTESLAAAAAITAIPEGAFTAGSGRPSARTVLGSAAERHKHPDPRAWLEYIEKMRAAGLASEAEQEFKHFRDVYPGYSVPPEAAPADGGPQ